MQRGEWVLILTAAKGVLVQDFSVLQGKIQFLTLNVRIFNNI